MTALKKYARLESTGLWRENAEDQRREVIVRMGEATLMLSDPKSDQVLSHWSLPAVIRRNPGQRPALFAPGEGAAEELEIGDDEMIVALKAVQAAVKAATPRPGRLRGVLTAAVTLAILGAGAWFVPGAMVRQTAAVVPPAQRAEIGMRALDDVTRLTGAPCDGDLGLPALARLAERVFGPQDTPLLFVLNEGLTRPAHLPGGVILLPRRLIDAEEGPEALAGAALAEAVAAKTSDPMLTILDHAGLVDTFRLLTSGALPGDALSGFGEDFLRRPPSLPGAADLVAAFEAAQVPLAPFARAADAMGLPAAGLADRDPFKGLIPSPLISDADWVALQSVCDGR